MDKQTDLLKKLDPTNIQCPKCKQWIKIEDAFLFGTDDGYKAYECHHCEFTYDNNKAFIDLDAGWDDNELDELDRPTPELYFSKPNKSM